MGWVKMCFYGVGKTLLEIPSPSSGGQFFVVLLGMRIPRLSNLARTFTYIIYYVKEGGMAVLQPACEDRSWGRGPGQGRMGCAGRPDLDVYCAWWTIGAHRLKRHWAEKDQTNTRATTLVSWHDLSTPRMVRCAHPTWQIGCRCTHV